MFCEKCGNLISGNERFCEKCGAPVPGAEQAQAAPADSNAQPQAAPADPNAQGNYGYTPMPPAAPRKPLSPKAKKAILFGSIGAGVLAALLIVLFVAIIPAIKRAKEEASKIDITKYLTIRADDVDKDDENPSVMDGHIDGKITWNYEAFAKDTKWDDNKPCTAETFLDSISEYLTYEVQQDDGEVTSSRYFDDAKSDTTFKVTVIWPSKNSSNNSNSNLDDYGLGQAFQQRAVEAANEQIKSMEERCGIKFKHSKKTRTLEVGKELEKQNITIDVPVEIDLLSYIKENGLFIQNGYKSGNLSVTVDKFETEISGYKFIKDDDSRYTDVKIYKGDEYISSFDFDYSDTSYLDDGTTVTLSYDSSDVSYIADKGISLIGSDVTITLKAPDPFTAESAKTNVEALKTYFNEEVFNSDSSASTGDSIELKNIYFCSKKDSDYSYLVFVYYNATQKYYQTAEVNTEYVYMKDNKFVNEYGSLSTNSSDKTLAGAVENCWYLSKSYSKYYNNTQIL